MRASDETRGLAAALFCLAGLYAATLVAGFGWALWLCATVDSVERRIVGVDREVRAIGAVVVGERR